MRLSFTVAMNIPSGNMMMKSDTDIYGKIYSLSPDEVERVVAKTMRLAWERYKRRPRKKSECVIPPLPRYDNVYWEGIAWLAKVARHDYPELNFKKELDK